MLWIAFIFQYLWDTQQRSEKSSQQCVCCELLSFFSIFGIHNNEIHFQTHYLPVVNCFHFSVSLGYTTTFLILAAWSELLWIAFIFQYLWDTQQLDYDNAEDLVRCELLSFFSIFGIHNNRVLHWWFTRCVVNCFHFSVSLGYTTT